MRRKVTIEHIPFNSLQYDDRVQREKPVQARVRKLRDQWDFDKVGTLRVSQRDDGSYWVIDGNHRRLAAIDGGYGSTKARCEVHRGLTLKNEAEQFLACNDVRPVTPLDKYRAGIEAENPTCIGVRDTLARHGLKAANTHADGSVACVGECLALYERDPDLLDAVCAVATEAWGTRAAALEKLVFGGLGMVLGRYNGELDHSTLATKLSKYRGGPSALSGDARGLTDYRPITVKRAVAEIVVDTYNKGRRAGALPPL